MHVHFFQNGSIFFGIFTILIISYSIFVYAITADQFSVILATVFHLAVNITNMFFFQVLDSLAFMAISAGIWIMIAIVTIVRKKEKMFFKE